MSSTLQALSDLGLIESRRGLGMYVRAGARERLLRQEREQFLQKDWPALRAKLKRLGLAAKDLNWEST
jgi:GntR family transcriptional regulator